MRLIDADEFFDTFEELNIEPYNTFPTVDAEPVRHGRWEWVDAPVFGNPYGSYKCDCGNYVPHKTNYCPNCGAKMDEVVE